MSKELKHIKAFRSFFLKRDAASLMREEKQFIESAKMHGLPVKDKNSVLNEIREQTRKNLEAIAKGKNEREVRAARSSKKKLKETSAEKSAQKRSNSQKNKNK